MAGKFINTTQKNTIESLVDGLKDRLKNPYYLYNDKRGTVVDYYNQNTTKSTVDENSNQIYSLIGPNSPLRFNKIIDAFIYGISRADVNAQITDYGLQADSIEGEAIVLPNTFVPVANDYFRIKYIEDDILFKVTNVSIDTLDNGANLYKISYKLDTYDKSNVLDDTQVVGTYKMILNNVGTNFRSVITSTKYDLINSIEILTSSLKTYFEELFYRNRVQTFIFNINSNNFYDPYMIEFLIRNEILNVNNDFIYVNHEVSLPKTFSIEYNKSFFRSIELGDKTKLNNELCSQAVAIDDENSLMSVRLDTYFKINYNVHPENIYMYIINNFPSDLIEKINLNEKYTEDRKNYKAWNIIISYFNNEEFTMETIEGLEDLLYEASIEEFYYIPCIIFILEKFIRHLMA